MRPKKPHVDRPAVDKMAEANIKQKVEEIRVEKPKDQTLTERVKDVLKK